MERKVQIDKRVCANVGGKMIPQKYIQMNNNIFYLQDRQHFNGLRVFFDRQLGRFYCVIEKEKIYLNGYSI